MTDRAPPMLFRYEGEGAWIPHGRIWAERADKYFVIGETYRIEWREERSMDSHRHFFAAINEGWKNLPDQWAELLPSPDHLRRYALIKTGFCDSRSYPCPSKADAERLAAFLKPFDEFALIVPKDRVITVFTAKSQSVKSMDRREFTASKAAVLEYVAGLIGTTSADLSNNAHGAA